MSGERRYAGATSEQLDRARRAMGDLRQLHLREFSDYYDDRRGGVV